MVNREDILTVHIKKAFDYWVHNGLLSKKIYVWRFFQLASSTSVAGETTKKA